jgi:hypothetical protein
MVSAKDEEDGGFSASCLAVYSSAAQARRFGANLPRVCGHDALQPRETSSRKTQI